MSSPSTTSLELHGDNLAIALRLSIGHALCEEGAVHLERYIKDRLANVVKTTIMDLGTALGVHGEPGSIVVGVQEYRPPDDFR